MNMTFNEVKVKKTLVYVCDIDSVGNQFINRRPIVLQAVT